MPTRLIRRCGLLAVAAGSGALLTVAAPPGRLATTLRETARHPQSTVDALGVESVALTVVALLAWFTLAWLALVIAVIAAAAAPGQVGRLATVVSAALVPAAVRQLVAATLGITLAAGVGAGTASAANTPSAPPRAPATIATLDLDWPTTKTPPSDPPPTSTRTALPAGTTPPPASAAPPPAGTTPPAGATPGSDVDRSRDGNESPRAGPRDIVVKRGDSLWSIAARHLGTRATDAQIARAWPRWWATNRHVIGDDPDQIKPGQRLTPPPDPTSTRRS